MLQKRLGQLSDQFLKYGLHKSLRLFCVYFCFDKFFEKRNKFLEDNQPITCAAFDKYYKGLSKPEIKVCVYHAVLQSTFLNTMIASRLPSEMERPKQGVEVPVKRWWIKARDPTLLPVSPNAQACRLLSFFILCSWCRASVQFFFCFQDSLWFFQSSVYRRFAQVRFSQLVFKGPVRSGFWAPGRLTETETGCLFWKSKNNRTETGNNRKIGY